MLLTGPAGKGAEPPSQTSQGALPPEGSLYKHCIMDDRQAGRHPELEHQLAPIKVIFALVPM